jgi:small subunit ribosomal protein S6
MPSLTPVNEDNRIYEIAVLYPFPLGQKEEQDLLKAVEEIFTEFGGKLVFKDMWGRRGLAYKIGGFTEGNYVIYYYELDPSKLKEIDQQLKILKGVLRHLMVKPPKHYQIASFAENYQKWKDDERMAGERAILEKEEKLKKQVVDKARKQTVKPVVKEDAVPMPKADITQEVDKLLSDTDIAL